MKVKETPVFLDGIDFKDSTGPFAEVYPVATLTNTEYSAVERYMGLHDLARSLKDRGINARIDATRNLGLGSWDIRLVIEK